MRREGRVMVEARLVDGGALDLTFGPEILVELDALDARGVTGKALIHTLITDDWGPPPVIVTLSWVRTDGRAMRRSIPYE